MADQRRVDDIVTADVVRCYIYTAEQPAVSHVDTRSAIGQQICKLALKQLAPREPADPPMPFTLQDIRKLLEKMEKDESLSVADELMTLRMLRELARLLRSQPPAERETPW